MSFHKIEARWRRKETLVLKRLIRAALRAGCVVSVNDGEEWTLKRSDDAKAIFGALRSTDGDMIRLRGARSGETVGNIWLVYGNDGWDVVADYTDNEAMETILQPVFTFADRLAEMD